MPAIGGVESAAPQRERGETLRRTGLPGDPLPVEGRGEDWIFCGWCVLVERASVERPDGPDDALLEECPSADERRSRHERARPLPPDSIVHDPILGSAADFRRDRGRRPDDDLTSLRHLSDRIRVEQVGATRFPTERSHRRLCGFASCEAHDPVIARDELPNDSAPEHPAGARHEHAHTEVMSIERLNIAGLIVPESGGGQTMVEFDLTDEQRLLQKTAHEFAEREMRPAALEYDKKGTVPWDVIGKAHALGLDTAFIPEAYGGGGIDSALTPVIVNDALNWGCAGRATGLIGAGLGIRAFVVEHGTRELEVGKVEDKMGVRASHTAEVILDDCRIPEDNLLGSDEGTAFYGAMKTLESSRPLVASGAVGIARAAYEYALDYSRKRKAFGTPIAKKQAIAFMLADMKTKIEAARLLTWRAAWMLDHGLPMNKEASIAKLFAADMAMDVTTDAVQILGGAGYMKDEPVEKWMRDAKIFQIWEGTSQIQRLVISREEIGEL